MRRSLAQADKRDASLMTLSLFVLISELWSVKRIDNPLTSWNSTEGDTYVQESTFCLDLHEFNDFFSAWLSQGANWRSWGLCCEN